MRRVERGQRRVRLRRRAARACHGGCRRVAHNDRRAAAAIRTCRRFLVRQHRRARPPAPPPPRRRRHRRPRPAAGCGRRRRRRGRRRRRAAAARGMHGCGGGRRRGASELVEREHRYGPRRVRRAPRAELRRVDAGADDAARPAARDGDALLKDVRRQRWCVRRRIAAAAAERGRAASLAAKQRRSAAVSISTRREKLAAPEMTAGRRQRIAPNCAELRELRRILRGGPPAGARYSVSIDENSDGCCAGSAISPRHCAQATWRGSCTATRMRWRAAPAASVARSRAAA